MSDSRPPEILAPAGDMESLRAALAAGADAVYLGVAEGFNARARATSFPASELSAVVLRVHRAGARAYLTLNTLVLESELAALEDLLRLAAEAGVDAIIVQDPAVALLAGALCPSLPVHASTQMGVSTPMAARFARGIGVRRVIVPRELSVADIERFSADCDLELEVFVHGALCMSWSGQCVASLALLCRSGNRGECAQPCRLPYQLLVDGEPRDLGEVRYLLSPRDLMGRRAVGELVRIGVASLKIEGRLKGPQYVATAVAGVRAWVAAAGGRGQSEAVDGRLQRDMALTFSRGFGEGFLLGLDHQAHVDGRCPKHRGLLLGRVASIFRDEVLVTPAPEAAGLEVRPGMGVVFDSGRPEDPSEPGGPVFRSEERGPDLALGFGRPGPDLKRVREGQRVWVTSDPAIGREVRRLLDGPEPEGRIPLRLEVEGAFGGRLTLRGRADGCEARVMSEGLLESARGDGLDAAMLEEKLGALGGTPFLMTRLDAEALAPGLHLQVSELKVLRRRLVSELEAILKRGPRHELRPGAALPRLRRALEVAVSASPSEERTRVVPLCRTPEQLEAALALGLDEIELDFMDLNGLEAAVRRARQTGARVIVATPRVTRPNEGYDEPIARLAPDGILVRHLDALVRWGEHAKDKTLTLHGDASLNAANSVAALHFLAQGLATLTPSHDAQGERAILTGVPALRMTILAHGRLPLFHTEHCLYARHLSEGRDKRTCGRPCKRHHLGLRDQSGRSHPVMVDATCRNTVFEERPRTVELAEPLAEGVRRFRVELLGEGRDEARRLLMSFVDRLSRTT